MRAITGGHLPFLELGSGRFLQTYAETQWLGAACPSEGKDSLTTLYAQLGPQSGPTFCC